MIVMEKVRRYMESLDLTVAVEVLEGHLDEAARKELSYPEMLEGLLGVEVSARRERYLSTRTRMANLPFVAPWRTSTSASSHP